MGQYYLVANFTKKQYFRPLDGSKLLEFSYQGARTVNAITNLLSGEFDGEFNWVGDDVLVIGDYTDENYPENVSASEATESFEKHLSDYQIRLGTNYTSLYEYVSRNFQMINLPESLMEEPEKRYLINRKRREYVDLNYLPLQYYEYPDGLDIEYIAPLPLLLAVGNGLGGGDYQDNFRDYEKVGLWTTTSEFVTVSDDRRSIRDLKNLEPYFYIGH